MDKQRKNLRPTRFENASAGMKALLLLLVILTPFIIAEIGLQIYYRRSDGEFSERNVKFSYIPFLNYFHRPLSQVKQGLFTDRHGFITNGDDNERDLTHKPVNEFRVFILGGSTVAGSCVPSQDLTISARLQKSLKTIFAAQGINLEPHVINAGVSGYFSVQETSLLEKVLVGLSPDYVIMFDGANDFHNNTDETWMGNDIKGLLRGNYDLTALMVYESYDNMFTLGGLLRQLPIILQDHSAIFRFIMDNYRRVGNKLQKESARFKSNATDGQTEYQLTKPSAKQRSKLQVDRLEHNIRAALSLTLGWPQMSYAYVLQPIIFSGMPMTAEERQIAESWNKEKWAIDAGQLDARETFFELTGERIASLASKFNGQKQLTFVDLSKIFASKSPDVTYACDHVHYTPEGYSAINDALLARLGPHLVEAGKASARMRN